MLPSSHSSYQGIFFIEELTPGGVEGLDGELIGAEEEGCLHHSWRKTTGYCSEWFTLSSSNQTHNTYAMSVKHSASGTRLRFTDVAHSGYVKILSCISVSQQPLIEKNRK